MFSGHRLHDQHRLCLPAIFFVPLNFIYYFVVANKDPFHCIRFGSSCQKHVSTSYYKRIELDTGYVFS